MSADAIILKVTDSAVVVKNTDTLTVAVGSTVPGPAGPQGASGPQGPTGSQGPTGAQGPVGSQGSTGSTGSQGASGAQGATGPQGAVGAQGSQGSQGLAGDKYATTSSSSLSIGTGAKTLTVGTGLAYSAPQEVVIADAAAPTTNYMIAAVTGYVSGTGALSVDVQNVYGSGTKSSWIVNLDGAVGPQGSAGSQGSAGPQGAAGAQGASGAQGATGAQGSTGAVGAQGAAGAQGSTGAQGATGSQGASGAQGAQGSTGSFNANSAFQGALEVISVDGSTTLSGSTPATISIKTAGAYLFTVNPTASWTINVRGDSSTTLASMLATGQSVTVTVAVTNGATAYYASAFQVDGNAVTPKWVNGAAPSAGSASSIDAYTFVIVKTAATPTYTVLASVTKFA